jgi:hypothetical protein
MRRIKPLKNLSNNLVKISGKIAWKEIRFNTALCWETNIEIEKRIFSFRKKQGVGLSSDLTGEMEQPQ